jgi:hypothetical protein
MIASTLRGSNLIPNLDTMKPSKQPDSTQKYICVDLSECCNIDNVQRFGVGDLRDQVAWETGREII